MKILVEVECSTCKQTGLAKQPVAADDFLGGAVSNVLTITKPIELPTGWGWYGYGPGRHDLIMCPEHKDK